jgi:hypothetical protein
MKKRSSIIVGSFAKMPLKQLCNVPIIVVYTSPLDFPGKFVARLWDIYNKPTAYAMVADILDDIRKGIPETMTRLPPDLKDDQVIVETWL